jgi:hypothetical protein
MRRTLRRIPNDPRATVGTISVTSNTGAVPSAARSTRLPARPEPYTRRRPQLALRSPRSHCDRRDRGRPPHAGWALADAVRRETGAAITRHRETSREKPLLREAVVAYRRRARRGSRLAKRSFKEKLTMKTALFVSILVSASLATLASGCSAPEGDASHATESAATDRLAITTALRLDRSTALAGETVNATVTYTNDGAAPNVVESFVIASRPPGGSHAGGPYLDFTPSRGPVTLAPGESYTVSAARAFTSGDATGAWDVYPTYRDGDGAWHDGPEAMLVVGEAGRFAITSALALDATTIGAGQTVTATVTYANDSPSPVVVKAAVIAARPPGGTHAGGPYDDFAPYTGPVTVAPRATVTVTASRAFTGADPTGVWDIYATYQDDGGIWHDGPGASLTVSGANGGAPLVHAPLSGNVSTGSWQSGTTNGMGYALLLPEGYSAASSYPLVLYLHQLDNASQIPSQIDPWFNEVTYRREYPSIVVAPQCDMTADPSGNTINWGGVSSDPQSCQDNAIALVRQLIANYSVYKNKVYVTGNSMGGIGSWDIIIKYNTKSPTVAPLFAATLILAGATYDHGYSQPDTSVVTALKDVPIWSIHGAQDGQVPLDWDRNMFAAEQALGGAMRLLVDPNLGHDVWDTYYVSPTSGTYFSWLFAQSY